MVGIAIKAYSKVGLDTVVSVGDKWTFGRSLDATSKVGQDGSSLDLRFGRSIAAEAKVSHDVFALKLAIGRAISANSAVGTSEFLLLSLLGKIVFPPSAELFILKNGQEELLENNRLTRGDFVALNLRIIGDRVASEINGSMNVSFTGKLDPSHEDGKALFRKTIQNGGVKFLGVEDVVTYKGKSRAATYQIRLSPADTAPLLSSTLVYSDIQIDDGMRNGERYTVNKSRFYVDSDVYRGVGGGYP